MQSPSWWHLMKQNFKSFFSKDNPRKLSTDEALIRESQSKKDSFIRHNNLKDTSNSKSYRVIE